MESNTIVDVVQGDNIKCIREMIGLPFVVNQSDY